MHVQLQNFRIFNLYMWTAEYAKIFSVRWTN